MVKFHYWSTYGVLGSRNFCIHLLGVANGLSKMLSLGKFTPSLGISALKNSVSESRISRNMMVSESDFENLDLGVSDFENLDLGVSDFLISKSRQWESDSL